MHIYILGSAAGGGFLSGTVIVLIVMVFVQVRLMPKCVLNLQLQFQKTA